MKKDINDKIKMSLLYALAECAYGYEQKVSELNAKKSNKKEYEDLNKFYIDLVIRYLGNQIEDEQAKIKYNWLITETNFNDFEFFPIDLLGILFKTYFSAVPPREIIDEVEESWGNMLFTMQHHIDSEL